MISNFSAVSLLMFNVGYYLSTEGDRRLATGMTAMVEAWKKKRDLGLAISSIRLDNSGEPLSRKSSRLWNRFKRICLNPQIKPLQ